MKIEAAEMVAWIVIAAVFGFAACEVTSGLIAASFVVHVW